MGSIQSNLKLTYYGRTTHPIVGEVEAYFIKGQGGRFAMKTTMSLTQEQLNMFQLIGKGNNPRLVAFFGLASPNPKGLENSDAQVEREMLWELLNYDLASEVLHLQQSNRDMEEALMWQIMDAVLECSQFLQAFDVYLEILPRKIQFSAAKEPKMYWADILPGNMHRAYDRYIGLGEFRHTIYSPEELLEITRAQRKQLNKEKCVMFNLGMALLEAATKQSPKKMYDYASKAFSEVKKREMVSSLAGKYSSQFIQALNGLLEYFPKQRLDYRGLETVLDSHFKRNNVEVLSIDIDSPATWVSGKQSKTGEKSEITSP